MSIGEWMKFCSDFGVAKIVDDFDDERKNPDRVKFRTSAVQVPFLQKIYKGEGQGGKGILHEAFVKILSTVAKNYPIIDKNKPAKELLWAFYNEIGIDSSEIKTKMGSMKTQFFSQQRADPSGIHCVGSEWQKKRRALKRVAIVKQPNPQINKEVFNRLFNLSTPDHPPVPHTPITQNPPARRASQNRYMEINQVPRLGSGRSTRLKLLPHQIQREKPTYTKVERKRHVYEDQKKITWDSLEKMG
jgi:hypothetical protein